MEVARLDIVIRSQQAVQANKDVQGELEKTANVARTVTAPITGAFDKLKNTIFSVRGALGTLTAAFGIGSIIGTIRDFEKSMSAVRAVTGATAEDFEKLTTKARQLGATTTFSASEAADAMFQLGQAGFDAGKIIDSVGATLKLAQAGMLGIAEAADIAAQVLNNFNLQATETGRVADVLTVTANVAATGVREIGEAMKYVGPIAASTGQSLEDITAVIGALSNAGLDSSMAGTGIRQMLLALVNPTKSATFALKDLGIELKDIDPTSKDIISILKTLAAANITAGQASAIFGDRAATAVAALTNMIPTLEKTRAAIGDATGAADEFAVIMTSNLAGAISELQSAFEEMTLQTGDAGLSGALKGLIGFTTDLLNAFNGLLPATKENAETMYFLKDAITVAAAALAGFAIGKAVAGLVAYGSSILQAITAIRGMTIAQLALNAALLANPIVLVATLVAGAAAAYFVFRDKTRDATQAQTDFNAVMESSDKALDKYRGSVTETSGALDKLTKTQLQASLAELQSELRKTEGDFDTVKKAAVGIGGAFYIANEDVTGFTDSFGPLLKEFKTGAVGIDELIAKLQELGEGSGDVAEDARLTIEALLDQREAFNRTAGSTEALKKRIEETKQAVSGFLPGLEEVVVTLKKVGDTSQSAAGYSKEQKQAILDLSQEIRKSIAEFNAQAAAGSNSAAALNRIKAEAELAKAGISELPPEIAKLVTQLNTAQEAAARSELADSIKEQITALKLQTELGDDAALALQRLKDETALAKKGATGFTKELENLYKALKEAQQNADAVDLTKKLLPAKEAAEDLTRAQNLLIGANERKVISDEQLEKGLVVLENQYRGLVDPLKEVHRLLDEEATLLGMNAQEREIEVQLMQTQQALLAKGTPLTKEETAALREKLEVLQQTAAVTQAQDDMLERSVERRKEFATQLQALQELLANPSSGFTAGDAASETVDLVEQMGLNPEGMRAAAEENSMILEEMYARINELRQADLISEQEAFALKAQAWVDSQQIMLSQAESFFGSLTALQKSENRKQAQIGKAAAIAQTVINTYQSATAAFNSLANIPYVGPFLGAAAAAAAVVAGMQNVARIRSTNTTGFAFGGGFTVGGFGGVDSQTVAFRATPGERVTINTPEQARAMAKMAGQAQEADRGGRNVNVTQNLTMVVQGRPDRRTQDQYARAQRRAVQSEARKSSSSTRVF